MLFPSAQPFCTAICKMNYVLDDEFSQTLANNNKLDTTNFHVKEKLMLE